MPGMNLVDPALWNSTIQGKANPLSVPKAPRFGGRSYNPRPDPGLSGRGLVQAATGGVAPAASPGGPTVNTAPGANLATAVPGASKPDFTPIRTSAGGSMVLGKDNLGVEEIRGTGHPSAQLYQAAGVGEAYPGAVAAWRSGLAREQGETERAGLAQAAETERARIQAETTKASRPDITFAVKQAEAALPEQEAAKHTKAFTDWLHTESPYATFTPGKGLSYAPKDEGMARDEMAARSIAGTQGVDAAKKLFAERQEIRKWLLTQPLNPNADIEAWLNAGQANPEHWARLLSQVRTAAAAPPTAPAWTEPEKIYSGQSPFTPGP